MDKRFIIRMSERAVSLQVDIYGIDL